MIIVIVVIVMFVIMLDCYLVIVVFGFSLDYGYIDLEVL